MEVELIAEDRFRLRDAHGHIMTVSRGDLLDIYNWVYTHRRELGQDFEDDAEEEEELLPC